MTIDPSKKNDEAADEMGPQLRFICGRWYKISTVGRLAVEKLGGRWIFQTKRNCDTIYPVSMGEIAPAIVKENEHEYKI